MPPWPASRFAVALTIVGTLTLLLCVFTAPPAHAGEHIFDAKLSLTGDCSVSASIDPTPDPGCPGGTHPPNPFSKNGAVALDRYGNRYVGSFGKTNGSDSRIDIFTSDGEFITEVKVAMPELVGSIAVDSLGNLYVLRKMNGDIENLLRYEPTGTYNPVAGEITYGEPVVVPNPSPGSNAGKWGSIYNAIAVNPQNDHLFVAAEYAVYELGSASENNPYVQTLLDAFGGGESGGASYYFTYAIAIDAARQRFYVSDWSATANGPECATFGKCRSVVRAFDLQAPTPPAKREPLLVIDGSTTPTKRFVSETRVLPLAVDESTGHLFVGDLEAPTRRIYEFDTTGAPLGTIEGGLGANGSFLLQMAHDNSPTSPTEGYLFVPSGSNPGRSLAFGPPPPIAPPLVSGLSFSGITTSDATLRGLVNPKGLTTDWRIEYTTEQSFLAKGFEGALLAGEGTLKEADEDFTVSASASGLSPETSYRFRVVAVNDEGEEEAEATFSTYAPPEISSECPNQALRTGPSAALPDCRAYELVTPTNTNGRAPQLFGGTFPSPAVSPAGDAVSFAIAGTVLPGFEGTANLTPDPYLARRGKGGWQTEATGPSGAFSQGVVIVSRSPDQGHIAWLTDGEGPGNVENINTTYVRYPDGHFEVAGEGSLGAEPFVNVHLITENASHVVFKTNPPGSGTLNIGRQLEPNAPPNGTGAIYDRTADGILHVVSLLPGEITPAVGQSANFQGASPDGKGVAFAIAANLYLRYDNQETHLIGAGVTFAGLAEGGKRVFYLQAGNLKAFDIDQGVIDFTISGDVTPVNISADGSSAYFLSPSVLGAGPNPTGDAAVVGAENLYLSREGQIFFLGTLSQRDVDGVKPENGLGEGAYRGLGLWNPGRPALDPSRTTIDGSVLIFESNAQLTDYDPQGHTQIYRYDAGAETLECLSCNPTGRSGGDNALQSLDAPIRLLGPADIVQNLSHDGRRVFLESTEALVASDVDGLRDVYEWEAEGKGSCERPGGCLYLISSANSARDEYLWGASSDGEDVMVVSNDLLAPAFDFDETASIYDARAGGGFAPPAAPSGECLGEACQPAAAAPTDPIPAFRGAGNVIPQGAGARPCPKGKRKVKRNGKVKCVKKKRKGKANEKRRAGK